LPTGAVAAGSSLLLLLLVKICCHVHCFFAASLITKALIMGIMGNGGTE
jgi:hypothetical protein